MPNTEGGIVTTNKSKIKGIYYKTRKVKTKRWVIVCLLDGTILTEEMYVPQLGNRTAISIIENYLSESYSNLDWNEYHNTIDKEIYKQALTEAVNLVRYYQIRKYEQQYKYQRENAKRESRKH